jgi:hypothetical protein
MTATQDIIRTATAADILAWREERAAIREFCGGQERDQAEHAATGEMIRLFACAPGLREAMKEIETTSRQRQEGGANVPS